MLTPENVLNVLGQRGNNPQAFPNFEKWSLIDRLDGQGIQVHTWDAELGAHPSNAELTLAATPLIVLGVADNAGNDGIIVTATLTLVGNQTVNWRCIDPDGVIYTDSAAAVAGVDTWEIITGKAGNYTIQAWASGLGFAQTNYEEA